MKGGILVTGFLTIALALGFFVGRMTSVSSAPSEVQTGDDPKKSAKEDANAKEPPASEIENSPRFSARIDLVSRVRSATVEELWAMLDDPVIDHRLVWDRLVELDASGTTERVRRSGDSERLTRVLGLWASKDPVAAYNHIKEMPPLGHSSFWAQKVYDRVCMHAFVNGNHDLLFEVLDRHRRVPTGILHELSAEQMQKFLGLLAERNYSSRYTSGLVKALAAKDYDAAVAWVDENSSENERPQLIRTMLQSALMRDYENGAPRVLAFLEENPDQNLARYLIGQTAKRDVEQAIAYLEKFAPDDPQQRRSMAYSVVVAVGTDERLAMKARLADRGYFGEMERGFSWPPQNEDDFKKLLTADNATRKLGDLTRHGSLFRIPPTDAAKWIAAADPATVSPSIANFVAHHYAGKDPKAALEWAAGLDDALSLPAARSVLNQWVALDSKAAMGYAAKLPESEFQLAAADAIVKKRASMDKTATREWIGGLGEGRFRDAATGAYVSAVSKDDHEILLPSVRGIADESIRRKALLHILDAWPAEEADGFWEKAGVTKEDREFLEAAR